MPREKSPREPMTRRYPENEKAQAVRLVRQLRRELATEQGTVKRVVDQRGYGAETVRKCVRRADACAVDDRVVVPPLLGRELGRVEPGQPFAHRPTVGSADAEPVGESWHRLARTSIGPTGASGTFSFMYQPSHGDPRHHEVGPAAGDRRRRADG